MFTRLAVIATAATLMFSPMAGRASDHAAYNVPDAIHVLLGNPVAMLDASADDAEIMALYAVGFAAKLNYLWDGKVSEDFGLLPILKGDRLVRNSARDKDSLNQLFQIGAEDAETFAARNSFDSEAGRAMLVSLRIVLSN